MTCGMPVWRNDRNCKYMFTFVLKTSARKELRSQLICPRICGSNFKSAISENMIMIKFKNTLSETALRRMPKFIFNGESTMVQVMA